MQPQTVWALYFSPTGNAARLAVTLAKSMAEALGAKLRVWDFTLPKNRVQKIVFKKEDLVVVSTPVYAGRVPNKLLPYLENNWQGNGALAIPLVSFGNRAFDDALIELCNLLEADGFHTVAAGAQPSQHAFSALLAPGRPRADDLAAWQAFGREAAEKVRALAAPPAAPIAVPGRDPVGPYYIPLGTDGQPVRFLKATPKTAMDKCTHCGLCAKICPMGSISPEDPAAMIGICLKCQACVQKCPTKAKYFDDPAFLSHVSMLEASYGAPKEAVRLL